MKLGVFSGQYFWFDERHYSTDEAFIKFVISFHPYFEQIIFCDAVREEIKTRAYILDPQKTGVCSLPDFNVYSFWRNILVIFPGIYRIIKENVHNWDLVWLHAPHPVSLIFAYLCRKANKPFLFFVRQNLRAYLECRNRGARKILAVVVARILEHIFWRLSRRVLTFTVGREIFHTYQKSGGPVYEVFVSLVSEKDLTHGALKKKAHGVTRVKLLSVGRLDPEKGIIHLVRAVGELVSSGNPEISLDIVGTGSEEDSLRYEVNRLRLNEHVNFLGYVNHGDHLLSLYKKCDIFVLPSLTEGWPQAIFEAMACGTPVVATKVGGIPYLIKDGENGLLVNPGSIRGICEAVGRLKKNSELRDRLIRNGLSTVRNHTMESEKDGMIWHIEEFLRGTRRYV